MKFGQWLAAERKRKAFTQDSFAVAAGYSQAMISKIENGGYVTRRADRGGGVANQENKKKQPLPINGYGINYALFVPSQSPTVLSLTICTRGRFVSITF